MKPITFDKLYLQDYLFTDFKKGRVSQFDYIFFTSVTSGILTECTDFDVSIFI